MAVTIKYSAQEFSGRGGSVYPVTFPAESAGDVWVAVKPEGSLAFTTLLRTEFSVAAVGGGAFEVSTANSYGAEDRVKIFRVLEVTQPFQFPEGGAFPAREVERAMDRLLMLVQQVRLETGLDGSTVTLPGDALMVQGLVVVSDAAERALTPADYAGQVLVQESDQSLWVAETVGAASWRAVPSRQRTAANAAERTAAVPQFLNQALLQTDTGTLYYATGITAGAWREAAARAVPTGAWPARLKLTITGDAGEQGARQTALAAALNAEAPDYAVFCGDNNYGGEAQFPGDWAAFSALRAAQKVLPVLGNHDVDEGQRYTLHTGHFPYLPGNRRYWSMVLGNGLAEVFVLNDGINSRYDNPTVSGAEPDGNAVGSAQHTWFVQALNASTARWKLVFFHHPLVTCVPDQDVLAPAMDWPEFARVHAIFNGHTHLTEWLTFRGIPVINASGAVRSVAAEAGSGTKTDGDVKTGALQSVAPGNESLIYANDRDLLYCRLNLSAESALVEFVRVDDRRVMYQRHLQDAAPVQPSVWGAEVTGPEDDVTAGVHYVGICPLGLLLHSWFISTAFAGSGAVTGRVLVQPTPDSTVESTGFTIPAGQRWVRLPLPNMSPRTLPLGAEVNVEILTTGSYPPWRGLSVYACGAAVQP